MIFISSFYPRSHFAQPVGTQPEESGSGANQLALCSTTGLSLMGAAGVSGREDMSLCSVAIRGACLSQECAAVNEKDMEAAISSPF